MKRSKKAKVRPERTEHGKARERLKGGVSVEIGQLHKTNALLIATQFAANHECEFDASDAVAAIIVRVEQTITTLDRLCLEVRNERPTPESRVASVLSSARKADHRTAHGNRHDTG